MKRRHLDTKTIQELDDYDLIEELWDYALELSANGCEAEDMPDGIAMIYDVVGMDSDIQNGYWRLFFANEYGARRPLSAESESSHLTFGVRKRPQGRDRTPKGTVSVTESVLAASLRRKLLAERRKRSVV